MNAINLISDIIPPIKTSDTGEDVLRWMNEFQVKHLPIVNNRQFLGLISEDDILDNDTDEAIGSYRLSYLKPYAYEYDHVYSVLKVFTELKLSVVPVVDKDLNYLGMVTQQNLLNEFARFSAIMEPGGIVVIEVGIRDLSLTEIIRIVESNDAQILSLYTTTHSESTKLDVTIKINRTNLRHIVATFERFNYVIKGSYQENEHFDLMKERYDSLMKYINI